MIALNSIKSSRVHNFDPFGMITVGRSWEVGSEYRYGFNTQEKVDEVYGIGNLNTAEFWQYDTRLGRRWNVDPIFVPNISGYVCFSNCPIYFVDRLGNKVDPNSEVEWENHKRATADRLMFLNTQKEKLVNQTKPLSIIQKAYLIYVNRSIKELNQATIEMEIMENDPIIEFSITNDPNSKQLSEQSANGITERNVYDKIHIIYNGKRGTLAHELKHAYQYLTGEVMAYGFVTDYFDEVDAFARGYAYDNTYHSFNSYDEINYYMVKRSYKNSISWMPLNSSTPVELILIWGRKSIMVPNAEYLHGLITNRIEYLTKQYQKPTAEGGA